MSKSSKDEWRFENLRDTQTDAMQGVLFTLVELGEKSAFLQLELEGVMHYCAARKLTQAEFDDLVRQAVVARQT